MGNKTTKSYRSDRREIPKREDAVYRVVIALNVIAWLTLVIALVLFHYARPDFVTGLQQYWGLEGDTNWSEGYLRALRVTLQVCLGLSLVSIILRSRRTRRHYDRFGVNLFVLSLLAVISLITLNTINPAG